MERKKYFTILLFSISLFVLHAQDNLALAPADMIIQYNADGGYDLWIKKKPEIESVLLTETTADPAKKDASYALRSSKWHPANGDEKRLLEGKFIKPESRLYSLIDSTAENHPQLGEAFHIFIPLVVIYGYPWTRSGFLQIDNGAFINIRTFQKPYGDYSGRYYDNPFQFVKTDRPVETNVATAEDSKNIREDTLRDFKEIAEEGGGEARVSLGEEDIITQIDEIIKSKVGESLDLILSLDTTASMKDDIFYVKNALLTVIQKYRARYKQLRVGVVFYKDYLEQYVVKTIPFTEDYETVSKIIESVSTQGGRDIPEAVYEALDAAVHQFSWNSQLKLVILIGDAPPHPVPRGTVTKEKVFADAAAKGIELHSIILPQ
ncbi:MAG: VWA domain-containing protein [Spirochaetales bacterium]|nr:VWA domain-containing protein [Spirochaetales bacterium]